MAIGTDKNELATILILGMAYFLKYLIKSKIVALEKCLI